jgi:hypothetical protein
LRFFQEIEILIFQMAEIHRAKDTRHTESLWNALVLSKSLFPEIDHQLFQKDIFELADDFFFGDSVVLATVLNDEWSSISRL